MIVIAKMKKQIAKEQRNKNSLEIPLRVLQNRNIAVLEAIVAYFKEEKQMKYSEIATLLNRDQRTIWTVYNRVKKKRVDNKVVANKKAKKNE